MLADLPLSRASALLQVLQRVRAQGRTPTYCRSRLAGECGGSDMNMLADTPLSRASALLEVLQRVRAQGRTPTYCRSRLAGECGGPDMNMLADTPLSRASALLEVLQRVRAQGRTPTYCRSRLAGECGGPDVKMLADTPLSPASRLLRRNRPAQQTGSLRRQSYAESAFAIRRGHAFINRYPTPASVTMYCGAAGSSPSFCRRWPTTMRR
ncbi:hypothetical protein EC919_102382 [Pseudomonas graminis]|nr:hypothetical protein EC919_102382 [Pseudomonas graminis]